MSKLTSSAIAELETSLRSSGGAALAAIEERLSGRDEEEKRTLFNHFADGDSQVEAGVLGDTDLALLTHEIADLKAIDAALRRIEFGMGGLCIECGESIPLARLRAAPTAVTCVTCQARLEGMRGVARGGD